MIEEVPAPQMIWQHVQDDDGSDWVLLDIVTPYHLTRVKMAPNDARLTGQGLVECADESADKSAIIELRPKR